MQTIQQFIASHHIKMDVDYAPNNPNMGSDEKWMAAANHYKCTFHRKGKRLTTYFSQGCGITREPTTADVLNCLALDTAGIENARSFEEWCGEYGYDTDSRKAEKIWKVCQRQAEKLKAFIDDHKAFQSLLFDTESL